MVELVFRFEGLKQIKSAYSEFGQRITSDVAKRAMDYYAQQAKQRLEQDTPVRTGRLRGSTVIRNEGQVKISITQVAPYSGIVNERRHHFDGAIQVAEQWPNFYIQECNKEWGIMARKYSTR
jgi:hypothetical protein